MRPDTRQEITASQGGEDVKTTRPPADARTARALLVAQNLYFRSKSTKTATSVDEFITGKAISASAFNFRPFHAEAAMNAFRMELRRKSKPALPRGILDTDFPLFEIEEEDDIAPSPPLPKV